MVSAFCNPYAHRTFAVSSCLKPIPESKYLPGTPGYGSQPDGSDGYGTYLNGGVAISLIAFDTFYRAEHEEWESAFENYRRLMDQYETDYLYRHNNIYGFDGKGSGGQPYLTDNALAIWGSTRLCWAIIPVYISLNLNLHCPEVGPMPLRPSFAT